MCDLAKYQYGSSYSTRTQAYSLHRNYVLNRCGASHVVPYPADGPLRRHSPGTLLEAVQSEHLAVLGQRVDGRLLLPDPLGGRPERVAQFALEPAAYTVTSTAAISTAAAATAAAAIGRWGPTIGRPVSPLRGRAARTALLLPLLIRHQILVGRPVHHHLLATRAWVHLRQAHVPDVARRGIVRGHHVRRLTVHHAAAAVVADRNHGR